jgi:hypothetical protein
MTTFAEGLAFQSAAGGVDFPALLAGVRALQPKCVVCGIPTDESTTGVAVRNDESGRPERLCRACARTEIGERLVLDTPR